MIIKLFKNRQIDGDLYYYTSTISAVAWTSTLWGYENQAPKEPERHIEETAGGTNIRG